MKTKAGFSLIEIVIAITLFLFVVGFLIVPLGSVVDKSTLMTNKFNRISRCASVMEMVTATSFEGVALYDGYFFLEGEGRVQVTDFSPALKKIVVWIGDAAEPEVKFETLMVQP